MRSVTRWAVAIGALLAAAVFAHWLVTWPAPEYHTEVNQVAKFLLRLAEKSRIPSVLISFVFATMAITGLVASALACLLLYRVDDTPGVRKLAVALALGALAAAWLFFLCVFSPYREWIPSLGGAGRFGADVVAYFAGLLGPVYLMRFFIDYPRRITEEDWLRYTGELIKKEEESLRSSWRARFYPDVIRKASFQPGLLSKESIRKRQSWIIRAIQERPGMMVAFGTALALAALDVAIRSTGADDFRPGAASEPAKVLFAAVTLVAVLVPAIVIGKLTEVLRLHHYAGTPEDRRRIDWIYSTMFVGTLIVLVMANVPMFVGAAILMFAQDTADKLPMYLFFPYPFVLGGPLFFFAFVVALSLSIFYRGTVDPRLAARKVTVWSAIALVMTFLFVLVERLIAVKATDLLGLPPEIGVIVTGALVAATISPLRRTAERAVGNFVSRFLPLDMFIEGDRRTVVVAFSDLSGYTSMCARDERQGLLLGALLQQQAYIAARENNGRVVRAIGDAAMFEFPTPACASRALRALHARFPDAARALGLEVLPVHSGAHVGEVVAPQDNDLFGMTVNLAARLQDAAGPGQIVVSDQFLKMAALDAQGVRNLGEKKFKNVPEPMLCHELLAE